MTDAEKKLLMKDLCTRLLYGVKVSIVAHNINYEEDFGKTIIAELIGIQTAKDDDDITYPCFVTCYDKYKTQGNDIETIKPYLRPMSSMTEEEIEEYRNLSDEVIGSYGPYHREFSVHCVRLGIKPDNPHECVDDFLNMEAIDWLNKKGFDYRGLIPMGLALEAPKGMYIGTDFLISKGYATN